MLLFPFSRSLFAAGYLLYHGFSMPISPKINVLLFLEKGKLNNRNKILNE